MQHLFDKYYSRLDSTPLEYVRGIADTIQWDARLTGIKGARGVGKTTLLLQHLKKNFQRDGSSLYVSLDNIWFAENRLTDLTDSFVKQGGLYLYLDEVHKYPGWSRELKNIYDDYPHLHIVFTGSSLLEILDARADLSRRAVVWSMQGLSFREYLNMTLGLALPLVKLDDILNDQVTVEQDILSRVKPLKYFGSYLMNGYYPFFLEGTSLYYSRLEEVINMIIEIELPLLRKVEINAVPKLKKLLQIIAESVPFVPNISKLGERAGLNRNTVISYLGYLDEAHIIRNLYRDAKGITRLQKPAKIYLENTNLMYALSPGNVSVGNVRETFFISQVGESHLVEYAEQGDFIVAGRYVFETGGTSKGSRQLKDAKEGFVVADGIEYGTGNRLPLWLFGFLY
jgi:predicted AAA+ superfamily ATPase